MQLKLIDHYIVFKIHRSLERFFASNSKEMAHHNLLQLAQQMSLVSESLSHSSCEALSKLLLECKNWVERFDLNIKRDKGRIVKIWGSFVETFKVKKNFNPAFKTITPTQNSHFFNA